MLSDRQKLILSAIVDDYIRSAEPVGSRSISKRGDVGYSPATIRNEMSDLEELGYLEQPHTSAGRIPSHKGYRYYVDHLVQLSQMSGSELTHLKLFLAEKAQEAEKVIQHVAMMLSNLTNYTSIVLGPELMNSTLKRLQIIPLNETSAVAIVVTNTGHVENKVISIPEGMPMSEIEKVVNILNSRLAGVPLIQLKSRLYNEIALEMSKHISQYEELIQAVQGLADIGDDIDRLYLSGTTNILNQPEFKDVDKVKSTLNLLETPDVLLKVIGKAPEGIQVRIGSENSLEAISNCSLITATYSIDGKSLGTIGILGPTRMEYAKVIRLLDYFSKDMATILSRWYKQS